MDEQTIDYYNREADRVVVRYDGVRGGLSSLFPFTFSKGERVVDIGCGSGRDLRELLRLGVDAYGVEPSEGLRSATTGRHPELAERIFPGALPGAVPLADGAKYDGVVLSAVIMHIPDADLFGAAFSIRECIVDNGKLLVSFSTHRGDVSADEVRDSSGRLMIVRSPARIRLLFERLGFTVTSEWHTADAAGRSDVEWTSMLFRYSSRAPRPVDRIESILSADRKTATYKYALIRALCDLATTGYNMVRWTDDGNVAVPVQNVAKLWIRYYWPLFEGSEQIPQIQKEFRGGKPVAFREVLSELITHYRQPRSLGTFVRLAESGRLDPVAKSLYERTMKRITATIVKGPVTHAGGAMNHREFGYNELTGEILVEPGFYRELALIGPWIRDALLVRWAEMTRDLDGFRRDGIAGTVMDRLLSTSDALRMDDEIRGIYARSLPLECVWSGQRLTEVFELDHAVPFALWQDSSSWNLLPANVRINREKRDRLPTNALLLRRKEAIFEHWGILSTAVPERFATEASRLIGTTPSRTSHAITDQRPELFASLVEAVEYTAATRGVERWEP